MTKDHIEEAFSTERALKLALEALEYIDLCDNDRDFLHPHECFQLDNAIIAIKQTLAAPVQEPVAWLCHPFGDAEVEYGPYQQCENCMPLYTTPPAAPVQEPVVGCTHPNLGCCSLRDDGSPARWGCVMCGKEFVPKPAAHQPWVGLLDEEIIKAMPGGIYDCLNDPWDCGVGDGDTLRSIKKDVLRIARAIEAKLREKNT